MLVDPVQETVTESPERKLIAIQSEWNDRHDVLDQFNASAARAAEHAGAAAAAATATAVSPGVNFSTFLGQLSDKFNINKVGIAKLTDPPLSGQLISRKDELGIIIRNLCKRNVDSRHVIQIAAPPGYGKSALLTKLAEIVMSLSSTATMASSVCFFVRVYRTACLSVGLI